MKKAEIIDVLKFHATEPIPNTNQLAIPPYHFDSIAKELSEGEEKCPICGGELHKVCYKCTKELCSPFQQEDKISDEDYQKAVNEIGRLQNKIDELEGIIYSMEHGTP